MKKITVVLAVALAVAAVIILSPLPGLYDSVSTPTEHTATSSTPDVTQTILLSVDGLYTNRSIVITASDTALSVLTRLNATDPKLQLKTKEYSDLGTLVTGMGGIENGTDNKYWQYDVNGTMPQVGADVFVLHNGDVIDWRFASSTF